MGLRSATRDATSTTDQETKQMTTVTRSRKSRYTSVRVAAVIAMALVAWLVVAVAPAGAASTRLLESSFSGSDTPGGAFAVGPFGGVAVDNSSGPSADDVYVGEVNIFNGANRVVKFDAAGAYAGVEFKGEDTPAGSFDFLDLSGNGEAGGVAVDSSSGPNAGDVYVSDPAHKVIDRFNEEGQFICQITGKTPSGQAEEEPECAGATGSATPDGGFLPTGITVDPVNGD